MKCDQAKRLVGETDCKGGGCGAEGQRSGRKKMQEHKAPARKITTSTSRLPRGQEKMVRTGSLLLARGDDIAHPLHTFPASLGLEQTENGRAAANEGRNFQRCCCRAEQKWSPAKSVGCRCGPCGDSGPCLGADADVTNQRKRGEECNRIANAWGGLVIPEYGRSAWPEASWCFFLSSSSMVSRSIISSSAFGMDHERPSRVGLRTMAG